MSTSATLRRPGTSVPAGRGRRPPYGRRWALLGVVLALVLLLVAGCWLFAFSPVLATRHVVVRGAQQTSEAEVRRAAQVPAGRPLARVDLDAVAHRVGAVSVVRSVRVTRSWPQTVVVAVQERTAVLAVRQPQGFVLVDATGAAYLTRADVPKGVVTADVDPGNARLLSAVGVVATALPDALRARVRNVSATSLDDIALRLTNGDTVTWGSSDGSPLKAEVLTALLERKASYYDVSSPHTPSLR